MRVAIMISGRPNFTKDFDNFLPKLKSYDQLDWFFYLKNNYVMQMPIKNIVWGGPWQSFDIEWAKDKITSNLPPNNFLKDFQLSDVDEVLGVTESGEPQPFGTRQLKMFYNICKVNELRTAYEKLHNFRYDLVIKTRPDLGLFWEVDLQNYIDIVAPESKTIIMPNNAWFGAPVQANDHIGIGNSENMTTYCDVWKSIDMYSPDIANFRDAEGVLGHHLQINGITTKQGGFEHYIRNFPDLSTDWN